MEIEKRTYSAEFRAAEDPANQKIIGLAACFNSLSAVMRTKGGQEFREQVAPGAFREAIARAGSNPSDECRSLINHNPDKIMGRHPKTLSLQETERGLEFEIDPPDTSYARDLKVSMARGDIKECSFGFNVPEGGDSWKRDGATGMAIRTISKIGKLFDVSIVTYPAYDSTECSLRSIGNIEGEEVPPFNDTEIRKMRLQLAAL